MTRYRTRPSGYNVTVNTGDGSSTVRFAHDYLTQEMTRKELVEALRMLPLNRKSASCLVVIDRGIRDYIVNHLQRG